MKLYIIYQGNFPSFNHSAYKTQQEAEKEVERLEKCRAENNERCDKAKETPHFRGKSFLFQKQEEEYSFKEIEVEEPSA